MPAVSRKGEKRKAFIRRAGRILLLSSLLVAACIWTIREFGGTTHLYDQGRAELRAYLIDNGYVIDRVVAVGREKTPANDILERLDAQRGALIFDLDLVAARQRIETLGWVKSATVRRLYPDTIEVRLVEREPFARWQVNRTVHLIDADGAVIETVDASQFQELPMVVGEGAERRAHTILAALNSQPGLTERVEAAVLVSRRRWDLHLKNGVQVRLPENGLRASLRELARLQNEHAILARDIVLIDLRLPGKLVVRQSDEARARLTEAAELI